jgi:hypothetical protein
MGGLQQLTLLATRSQSLNFTKKSDAPQKLLLLSKKIHTFAFVIYDIGNNHF